MSGTSRLPWSLLSTAALLVACGGGGTPTSPTPPAPPAPPAPPPPWTVSGRVIASLTGAPIGGARVESFIANATTDAEGRFTLTAATGPGGNLGITVLADGHRTRETVIGFPRTGDAQIDLVSTSPPFDERFYNQLARDA